MLTCLFPCYTHNILREPYFCHQLPRPELDNYHHTTMAQAAPAKFDPNNAQNLVEV